MDQGHRETETLIKALEQKVNREYSQATQELTAKLEDYFRRFEVKDEKWRIMVQNGERTVEEYQKWRFGQMMVGERWENMRDSIAEDLHNQNLISRGMLTGRMPDAYALNHNWSTYDIEKAGRVNTGYTLYNRDAVERLLRDDPDLLKPPGVQMQKTFADWDAYINKDLGNIEDQIADIRKAYPTNMPTAVQSQLNRLEKEKRSFDKLMADGKDIRWQNGQIQSVTLQSILQGESIPNMAKRIANTMGEMNRKASIRYARTAMTSAQNGGRKDAYQRAKGLGINLQQEWIATLDFRTRHAHRQLDGQIRDIDEPFQVDGYDIEYPGDPAAPGYLVYNCRCTTAAKVEGWDSMSGQLRSDEDIEGMSYEEWKEGHSQPQDILSQEETSEAMRQRTIRDLYGGSGEPAPEPEPEPEPQPKEFAFTPAKTIDEAEEYIKQYVNENQFGAVGVSYKGVSVDVANQVNRTLGKFYEEYEVDKFGGIIAPAGNTKYGKMMTDATAAYSPVRKSFLLNRSTLKNMKTAEAHFIKERETIVDLLDHPEKYDMSRASRALRDVVANSATSRRATIPMNIEEALHHECGHVLERGVKQSPLWDDAKANMEEYGQRLSGYACQDASEYIAESFCSYQKGEGLADPTLIRIFESLRRK